ncbi:MAG: hypothetical protein E5X80_27315 [Mesorhizobium sp.]|nr:MAG: hypothetical protein EOR71_22580 [Mesorhizobium sp.]TIO48654.1 MAG: hypothetical protein E5X78_28690 [Mesorhizobium sp.]TIO56960.1 MAG: hypothetical protein E5X79_28305 [Mesorhizobium sp.]TJV58592.1 MAG: hypothetical protein E5X80_27315 [Mesorhizobium sp.]
MGWLTCATAATPACVTGRWCWAGRKSREESGSDPSRPPLPCRASPPLGGRSAVTAAFANLQRRRIERSAEAANLPPCGEMSGRTEGGAVPPASTRIWT